MKTILIGDADAPQLRYHAEVVLGLELPKIQNKPQIIAKILATVPGTTEIQVKDEPDSPAQEQAQTNAADHAAAVAKEVPQATAANLAKLNALTPRQAAMHHHDPKIDVFVPASNEPGGDRDVPLDINGVTFLVKRDVWVTVPYRIYLVLKDAIETIYSPRQDDLGRLSVESRDVYSYPFSTRNEPSEEEIAAWRERTDSVELA
jgi:hypothetical protein